MVHRQEKRMEKNEGWVKQEGKNTSCFPVIGLKHGTPATREGEKYFVSKTKPQK